MGNLEEILESYFHKILTFLYTVWFDIFSALSLNHNSK